VVVSHKVYRIAGIKMLRQSKEGTREEAGKWKPKKRINGNAWTEKYNVKWTILSIL
jgi:hypothetical protein